jgi:hypothetical protein
VKSIAQKTEAVNESGKGRQLLCVARMAAVADPGARRANYNGCNPFLFLQVQHGGVRHLERFEFPDWSRAPVALCRLDNSILNIIQWRGSWRF